MRLYIGAKQLQKFLQIEGFYKGQIDGIFGRKSIDASIGYIVETYGKKTAWSAERYATAVTQSIFLQLGLSVGTIDGLWGPNSEYALEQYQNLMRDVPASDEEIAQQKTIWPRYSQMEQFYGPVGQNIELCTLPYKMKLAWDKSETVTRMSLHSKCAASALRVFEQTLEHYGIAGISELRLDLFGGSLNVRKMRGGSKWSTHSWAAAIDIDPANNQFRWTDKQASLDAADYDKWWEFWEAEGWVSLGRERNFDWMHVQAVRL